MQALPNGAVANRVAGVYLSTVRQLLLGIVVLAGCAPQPARPAAMSAGPPVFLPGILRVARDLSADSMRGRGPWTAENEQAARYLAAELERLGAKPIMGGQLLVPFVVERRPRDTVVNVIGVLPARGGVLTGELIGITAHLDHLGVGRPDATGDSIYNGFLDAALPIGMVLDVARRYARTPGDRPLLVMFFNLEEQGLLGSRALVARADAPPMLARLKLLIGVDAGAPAGEALDWQLMGALPQHPGAVLADSLARVRGWTTSATPPRAISDVFPFSQQGVPIIFPIPGARWRGFTPETRAEAMRRFDHYHNPADEWNPEFPLLGTEHFADWLWTIVRAASR